MSLKIYDLAFDEGNEEELARHGITVREARQVLDGDPVVRRNKKGRSAPYIMIGATYGGRFLTMPIVSTGVEGVWRPVTGWDSEPEEIDAYYASRPGTRQ